MILESRLIEFLPLVKSMLEELAAATPDGFRWEYLRRLLKESGEALALAWTPLQMVQFASLIEDEEARSELLLIWAEDFPAILDYIPLMAALA